MNYNNNDLTKIKERIYDEELIEKILEELECEHIKLVHDRWEAQLPYRFGSNNRRSVQVKNTHSLSAHVRSRGIRGNIFTLIGYIQFNIDNEEDVRDNLYQIKTWICNLFGWHEYLEMRDDFEEPKKDYLSFLRPIQKQRKRRQSITKWTTKENRILDKEKAFSWFVKYPHISFLEDGIDLKTQIEFEVMFDMESNRVVFPIYNKNGELISIKGRYVGTDEYILDEMKYLYLINFDKSIELYNLHKALLDIEKTGEVIVFESEKSCMKAWQYGYKNTVALMGNEMSPVQAFILRSLGVNIIFAYDNDMDLEFIKKQAKQIKTRKCFYIKDEFNLLEEKDSPVDGGRETWEKIYKNCVKAL